MGVELIRSLECKEIKVGNTRPATGAWTTTNVSTDRSIDANAAVAIIGDGLCTLIEDLKSKGLIE